VFLGGGTPTILEAVDLERMFRALQENFEVVPGTEITMECAPGTLTAEMLDMLVQCGVNRVSLGRAVLVDSEAAAVGRCTVVREYRGHRRPADGGNSRYNVT